MILPVEHRVVWDEKHERDRYEILCASCLDRGVRSWVRAYQKQKKGGVMFRCRECGSKSFAPGTEAEMISKNRNEDDK